MVPVNKNLALGNNPRAFCLKTSLLTACSVFFLWAFAHNCYAGVAVFKISATVPTIVGVNDFDSLGEKNKSQDTTIKKILRDKKEVILKTVVAK